MRETSLKILECFHSDMHNIFQTPIWVNFIVRAKLTVNENKLLIII